MNQRLSDDIDAYLRAAGDLKTKSVVRRWATVISTPILWSLLTHRWAHSRILGGSSKGRGLRRFVSGAFLSILTWTTKVANKTDILATADVDGGVILSSNGHIILGARRVGRGTYIGERVTIGMSLVGGGQPIIGENVHIGSDSIIYGSLTIGNASVIRPGTVVTRSLPDGSVVEGNPARIVGRIAQTVPVAD